MQSQKNESIYIPSLYLFVYECFQEKSCRGLFIQYECIKEIFHRRFYRFPKPLYQKILKEMEEMGLIERIGNTNNIKYKLLKQIKPAENWF